jgi:hypothetical protein
MKTGRGPTKEKNLGTLLTGKCDRLDAVLADDRESCVRLHRKSKAFAEQRESVRNGDPDANGHAGGACSHEDDTTRQAAIRTEGASPNSASRSWEE